MPCCNQSIATSTSLTAQQRCQELEPHFTWEVQCDKVFVEWDGVGNPDFVRYELYTWVPAMPSGYNFVVIASALAGPDKNVMFQCVPEGQYAIRVTASVATQQLVNNGSCGSCGSTTYHYEEVCMKQWDSCNCLQPCPNGYECVGGDCALPISVQVNCYKECPISPTSWINPEDNTLNIDAVYYVPSGISKTASTANIYPLLDAECPGSSTKFPMPFNSNTPLSIGTMAGRVVAASSGTPVLVNVAGYVLPGETLPEAEARITAAAQAGSVCSEATEDQDCLFYAQIRKTEKIWYLPSNFLCPYSQLPYETYGMEQIMGCYVSATSAQEAMDEAYVNNTSGWRENLTDRIVAQTGNRLRGGRNSSNSRWETLPTLPACTGNIYPTMITSGLGTQNCGMGIQLENGIVSIPNGTGKAFVWNDTRVKYWASQFNSQLRSPNMLPSFLPLVDGPTSYTITENGNPFVIANLLYYGMALRRGFRYQVTVALDDLVDALWGVAFVKINANGTYSIVGRTNMNSVPTSVDSKYYASAAGGYGEFPNPDQYSSQIKFIVPENETGLVDAVVVFFGKRADLEVNNDSYLNCFGIDLRIDNTYRPSVFTNKTGEPLPSIISATSPKGYFVSTGVNNTSEWGEIKDGKLVTKL